MLLSIIRSKKNKYNKERMKEMIRIYILYNNLNILNKRNKNYIAIIILNILLRYNSIISNIQSLNKRILKIMLK
jgi:hypothetical protein